MNLCIPKMELEILTLFFLDMYFLRASKATTIDIVVCCKESDLALINLQCSEKEVNKIITYDVFVHNIVTVLCSLTPGLSLVWSSVPARQ